MNLQGLLNGLTSPDAHTRLQTARVIGMLDETAALEALAAQYQVETVSEVKASLAWAGRRVQEAWKTGYTTLDAIFKHFHLDYELQAEQDKNEAELLKKMQHDAEMQLLRERGGKSGNMAAGMLIGGALLGAQGMVMGAMAGLTPGAEVLSSGLEERPQIGQKRIPPTRPADTDIRMMVRRLQDDPNPDKRRKAAIDLGSISNNPAALPFLAQTFVADADTAVREAAQRAGKLIYWNAIYWEMEQSGAIAQELQRRKTAAAPPQPPKTSHPAIRRIQPQETPAAPPAPPPSQISLADILRKAEEKRQQRKK
ncbi:MAG: HEAT repeat domain-containing protein [Chloroflexi bacterium]|nr:HEAT repeat domain-containing protein [Chloroflexota bacterium]